ncbi:MAG: hypothetical protein QOE29_2406, partial [Gaiellaceae bacterium]|nr:hypothetical protein [Gaiellaceae bacterium]
MRRTALLSLLTLAAFVAAPAAAGDGPMFAAQGGLGAVNAKGTLRYVPVGVAGSTALEVVRTADGAIFNWRELTGSWGLPAIGSSSQAALSHDGRALVLERTAFGTSSTFLLLDPRTLQLDDRIALRGSFTFDAFSPDASRMYLIQYLDGTIDHYV